MVSLKRRVLHKINIMYKDLQRKICIGKIDLSSRGIPVTIDVISAREMPKG
jgi:hypothetical protein